MPLSGAQRWLIPRAPHLLATLIIALICASLAWQSLAWQRLLRSPQASPASQQQTPASPTPTSLLPLFTSPAAATSSTAAPNTNLSLTLMGSFVHADPARSSAIIAQQGSKAKRYLVGSQLGDGVLLQAVYRDRVVLKRNGRLETLAFKKRQGLPATVSDSAPNPDYNLEQLQQFEAENGNQLRERMQALQQQMQASDTPSDAITEQPTETE
ncbi:MAG: secretion protein XcpP [Pseudomonadaceae bacterium]|nr:secretion protein XcpP [Pseudomonadaceae bacterium]